MIFVFFSQALRITEEESTNQHQHRNQKERWIKITSKDFHRPFFLSQTESELAKGRSRSQNKRKAGARIGERSEQEPNFNKSQLVLEQDKKLQARTQSYKFQ